MFMFSHLQYKIIIVIGGMYKMKIDRKWGDWFIKNANIVVVSFYDCLKPARSIEINERSNKKNVIIKMTDASYASFT